MSTPRRLLGGLAVPLTLAGAALAAQPAAAGPLNGNTFTIDLSCSDGRQYPISVLDPAADQAPGHLIGGTSVLIPVAFAFDVTVLDSAGTVVEHFSSPLEPVRGRSGDRHDAMTCTYAQTETEPAPDGGEYTIVLNGTVLARVAH